VQMVVYKKLMNAKVGLEDLKSFQPALGRSLETMLKYEGDVSVSPCYGTKQVGGGSIFLNDAYWWPWC